MKSTNALGKTLAKMARTVNLILRPFLHYNYLQEERAYSFSTELSEGLSALRGNRRWAYRPFFFTVINKTLLLAVLLFSFLAFEVPFDAGTLVAGLSIAHMFLIVSPTPAGIGIVEGILAVALGSLGVSLSDATVVTFAYRGLSFWLPLLVGMFAFRWVHHEPPPPLPVTTAAKTNSDSLI
jgi:glycosyltransferase 2 family protein